MKRGSTPRRFLRAGLVSRVHGHAAEQVTKMKISRWAFKNCKNQLDIHFYKSTVSSLDIYL